MGKGSSFERLICKRLSRWWAQGMGLGDRDDIFWRSSQSGGRATQRKKFGKSTYGSYGDIAAVDPVGDPLLKVFTIELKRGRSHGFAGDFIDDPPSKVQQPFEKALAQAYRCHLDAGSLGWLLICKRDRKCIVVYSGLKCLKDIAPSILFDVPAIQFRVLVNMGKEKRRLAFAAFELEDFLKRLAPASVALRVRT